MPTLGGLCDVLSEVMLGGLLTADEGCRRSGEDFLRITGEPGSQLLVCRVREGLAI